MEESHCMKQYTSNARVSWSLSQGAYFFVCFFHNSCNASNRNCEMNIEFMLIMGKYEMSTEILAIENVRWNENVNCRKCDMNMEMFAEGNI